MPKTHPKKKQTNNNKKRPKQNKQRKPPHPTVEMLNFLLSTKPKTVSSSSRKISFLELKRGKTSGQRFSKVSINLKLIYKQKSEIEKKNENTIT